MRLTGGSSTLRALAINNFKLNAVLLASNGNKLEGNFIGLNPNGSTASPNLLDGIQITGSNNIVGGSSANCSKRHLGQWTQWSLAQRNHGDW